MTLANSSGVPTRPSGMSALLCARYASRESPEALSPPRRRSVMIRPGQTVLKVMLSLPKRPARVLIRPFVPGRTALESSRSGSGCLTDTDWIVSTRPHFLARMPGSTARTSRTTESSESSNACCHCSSDISSKKPRAGPPALATRTSTPPHCDVTRCTSASTSCFLVTSPGTARTSALVVARTSSAAVLRSLSVRAHIATLAPSAPKASAHALPMPLLAAVTSATLPFSPRSMELSLVFARLGRRGPSPATSCGSPCLYLLEEFGAVARRDFQTAQPLVAHHLEREPLARSVTPEREVELLPTRHLLGVERHDDVALLQPAAVARPLRHDARHHHALVHRVGEDAEPRALGPAHHAAVAEQLARVLAVIVDGDRERAAHDLVEGQVDHAEQRPRHREEPAAAEAGVLRAADDAVLEQVFPVRLELAEVGHEPAADAPLLGARGRHRDHRLAAGEIGAARKRHRGEALALDAHEGEADLEVLRHHLRLHAAALEKADVDGARAHHDVVDGENEARGVHDDAAAHALVAEDARGGMRSGHHRVQVHHGAEQVARELDGDVHQARPPRWRAKNSPTRRCASALAAASKPTVAPQHRPVLALRFPTSGRNR